MHVFTPLKIVENLWYTDRLTLFSRHVEGLQMECFTGSRASTSRSSSVASHLRMELLEASHLEFCKILRPVNCDRRRRDVRLLSQSCWGDRGSNSQLCTVVTLSYSKQKTTTISISFIQVEPLCNKHVSSILLWCNCSRCTLDSSSNPCLHHWYLHVPVMSVMILCQECFWHV